MRPGRMALLLTPCGPHSTANCLDSWRTPAFDALYAPLRGCVLLPAIEATWMMLPRPAPVTTATRPDRLSQSYCSRCIDIEVRLRLVRRLVSCDAGGLRAAY